MASPAAVIFEDQLHIPADVHDLARFRAWCHSPAFPDCGRIDYLAGDIEVDMSPEDLYTHGAAKTAIAALLHTLVADAELGMVFVDRARVTSPQAGLSVEPDVVVVLWRSLEAGRIREIPAAAHRPGRFVELEGPPDLVVEVVSDSSTRKDTERLPPLYAQAGVPELWLVDARGEGLGFEVRSLHSGAYRTDAEGWAPSPVLDRSLRLRRRAMGEGRWRYWLEHQPC